MFTLRHVFSRAKTLTPWITRLVQSTKSEQKLVLESLDQRHLIRLCGNDVVPFLQGLTTNDMKVLESPSVPAIFTMFLNKAGRVMCDTIVYRTPEPQTVLIECDKEVSEELKSHLKMYLVRRKIDIDDISEEARVWVLFGKNSPVEMSPDLDNNENVQAIADPRLQELGLRLLSQTDLTHEDLSQICQNIGEVELQENSKYNYKKHRYTLGVAEGIAEFIPNKLLPLEANCDLLNGVSFNKGCYIGQELTARVHHTGVIRKRHMPIQLHDSLPMDSDKIIRNEDGTKVGTVLGHIDKHGIGLMRIEQVLKKNEMFVDNIKCSAEVPQWWPPEVLNHVLRRDVV